MSREASVRAALEGYRRRFRLASVATAAIASAAASAVVLLLARAAGLTPRDAAWASLITFIASLIACGVWSWRAWTAARAAAVLESRQTDLDNLVITAEEMTRGRRWHSRIEAEVTEAALARLDTIAPHAVQPLGLPLSMAAGCVAALFALLVAMPAAEVPARGAARGAEVTDADAVVQPGDLRVRITPPAYTGRSSSALLNPAAITVLEGTRVRLESADSAPAVLVEWSGAARPFNPDGGRRAIELTAVESRPLLVRFEREPDEQSHRLLQLHVQPDERPVVRIRTPGKDVLFPAPTGHVSVEVEAQDDVALASLVLRYTRVSGSGETFTFEEGEWPLTLERAHTGDWTGRTTLPLAELQLQDGDSLVYRAIARDARPGADPSLSESYLIEIGRLAGVATTGFALPEDRDRQAISQQMLIIKTERLHADRDKLAAEAFAEQARMLAVEQRMVKAEFVFMTGGVVEDEVEEAAHSHELAEGRLENTGQAELLAAIREMSRAEARLTAADTSQALVYERAALAALQRAFDRRRYLLRTLPERARIDPSRRLSGELATARSSTQAAESPDVDPFVSRARGLLRQLQDASGSPSDAAVLASAILALAPDEAALQEAAASVASARDAVALQTALREAQRRVVDQIRERLARPAPAGIGRDPIRGRLVQELPRGGGQP